MEADDVAKEQTTEIEEKILKDIHGKEYMNSIFIGHGTSTLEGRILYIAGMAYERTMDKYKPEAKEADRETCGH